MPNGMSVDPVHDPRFLATIDVLRRAGATEIKIRYEDDNQPVMWGVDVLLFNGARELAGGLDPLTAAYRLAEMLLDGGTCVSCRRPSGISDDWTATMPLDQSICWYQYDPETQKYRRGCAGDVPYQRATVVGRNDPCPCGSGQKAKKCDCDGGFIA